MSSRLIFSFAFTAIYFVRVNNYKKILNNLRVKNNVFLDEIIIGYFKTEKIT